MLHSNAAVFERLVDLIERHGVIAFVGAGVSRSAKYPTWTELLDQLYDELPKVPTEEQSMEASSMESAVRQALPPKYIERLKHLDDLPWRAEKYRQLLGEKYFTMIETAFGERDFHTPLLESLGKLAGKGCFRHILTTNYDRSLEMVCNEHMASPFQAFTWSERDAISQFLAELSHPQDRYFIYLHGRYDQPKDIVLTESDYVRRYVVSDDANKKLFALFLTQPVLFIGFSLNDPDLAYLMRVVNAYLGAGGTSKDLLRTRRFAILPIREDLDDPNLAFERYQEKLGIAPIFYSSTPDHKGLLDTIEALHVALETGQMPAAMEQLPVAPEVSQTSDDPRREEFGTEPEKEGRRLSASVRRTGHPDWFSLTVRVESTDPERPLQGPDVHFFLHPTFQPSQIPRPVVNGIAEFSTHAYGAFTIGARVEDDIKLGLDLSTLPDAPEEFRSR